MPVSLFCSKLSELMSEPQVFPLDLLEHVCYILFVLEGDAYGYK
jgi:hypothetical protein